MRNYSDKDLRDAQKNATSYKDFKDNLQLLGNNVPDHVDKFPMGMKGWGRKLRYEISKDYSFGTPTTAHDIRQKRYYERLEKLGHPNPHLVM